MVGSRQPLPGAEVVDGAHRSPPLKLRLKVEINTREHFTELGVVGVRFRVDNPWFTGAAYASTNVLDDLLCTRLRVLYRRNKGRDLFDILLRRLAYNLLALFRRVTQRSEKRRATPCCDLVRWFYNTVIAATEADVAQRRGRKATAAALA